MVQVFKKGETFLIILLQSLTTNISAFPSKSNTMRSTVLGKLPKLILIDRDGVVNEDVGSPGVVQSSQLKLTEGAGVALGRLKRAGCKVALVTNQSCVGKGLITEDYLVHEIHKSLQSMLLLEDEDAQFDHIFYCTSIREAGDPRMKPNPGMIEEACNMFQVHASNCVMIGDAIRDLQAAATGGVPNRVLVETGYGAGTMNGKNAPIDGSLQVVDLEYCEKNQLPAGIENCKRGNNSVFPYFYVKNLKCAVDWILH
jgi:D-glycero-D-manno-heptose 1,7-bisphosphate phosphatase